MQQGQIMALTNEQKKHFKSIGHHLKPVLIVAENGLTEGVLAELERALNDHELIKVQLRLTEREDRQAAIASLAEERFDERERLRLDAAEQLAKSREKKP